MANGNIASITVQGETIEGVFEEPIDRMGGEETAALEEFRTFIPSFGDDELLRLL